MGLECVLGFFSWGEVTRIAVVSYQEEDRRTYGFLLHLRSPAESAPPSRTYRASEHVRRVPLGLEVPVWGRRKTAIHQLRHFYQGPIDQAPRPAREIT
jgi:hypothetical protein